jgi:hypothetical protein
LLSPLTVVVVGFILLALASTAVVVVGGTSSPAPAGGTPEQTLTRWAQAVHDGDYTLADTYLSSRLLGTGETSEDLAADMGLDLGSEDLGISATMSVESVSIQGDRATARLSIKLSAPGLGADVTVPGTATLVNEGGSWKIDTASVNFNF